MLHWYKKAVWMTESDGGTKSSDWIVTVNSFSNWDNVSFSLRVTGKSVYNLPYLTWKAKLIQQQWIAYKKKQRKMN